MTPDSPPSHTAPRAWPRRYPRWWRWLLVSARRARLVPVIAVVSVLAFIASTLSAVAALSDQAAKGMLLPQALTVTLLVGTLVPAMAILMLIGRWVALSRARAMFGGRGRLHVQLVFLFSLTAAIPTLLVVIFASWLFQSGVEFWFSDSSRGLLENANKLAQGYYQQTERDVSGEATAMASDLGFILSQTSVASRAFAESLSYQVLQRGLDDVAILQKGRDGRLRTLAIVDPSKTSATIRVSPDELTRIENGQPIIVNALSDRIEAITAIDRHAGVYLYAARSSDLLAIAQGKRAVNIVRAYQVLTQRARLLQLRFNIALLVASLAVVGLAVVFAIRLADRQVQPLYELVGAARKMGEGDYAMRVAGGFGSDEIGQLKRAFNRMAAQIERQTRALVGANAQLAERRAFIEAVLESGTAGVISLDAAGAVRLINPSAQALLFDGSAPPPVGEPLADVAAPFAALVAEGRSEGIVQWGKAGDLLTLAVRISRDREGHVITFEDITRQLLDQRQAAWSDVARRIAHEIKNPLTPIQLAAERLKRRYRKQILADGELFEDLTQTIIRQVGDLRKMVDEFSSFARLPKPVFRAEDAVDLARQALFLQEVARADIAYSFVAEGEIGTVDCDRHQFGQAMTNVLKNAGEAIDARRKGDPDSAKGRIAVAMRQEGEAVVITVTDNGIGLPQDRERITEPYMTTREKGTGLGLAIVKKIIEEHGGDMGFALAEGGGTHVTMRFARDPLSAPRGAEAAA